MKFMIIGIDASRAFLKRRTGIEEYSYQVIKHLRTTIPETEEVVLYVRKKLEIENWKLKITNPPIDFPLPQNWRIHALWAPRFWTQVRLSFEMLFHTPDVLFVPAHTVPLVHPKNTIVTIHGLEYEFCPESYSLLDRIYMRFSIRFSCSTAGKVICVSGNTKRDVMRLYGTLEEKIEVVYEGYEKQLTDSSQQLTEKQRKPYLLFIGRLEERKNVVRIIRAFEILKEKYNIPHQLVLVGKPGYGYQNIKYQISNTKSKKDIVEMGYIIEEEKWELLRNASAFVFPTLYEGFGIPVLEAQSVGMPVVTSNTSSLPEVGGEGAVYVDPQSIESIAEGIQKVLSGKGLRDGIIEKGLENVSRFSWQKCAERITCLFV